ncbi:MAG: hypothetical protein ACYDH6_15575 [Acidimicrobiales bacterium]
MLLFNPGAVDCPGRAAVVVLPVVAPGRVTVGDPLVVGGDGAGALFRFGVRDCTAWGSTGGAAGWLPATNGPSPGRPR